MEFIPCRATHVGWKADESGIVTLEIENKGAFHWLAQKLLKKPRISYIHLDEFGSFIWQLIDGESDIFALGTPVKEHFGDKADPLYERLVKFFQILESYDFITLNKEKA